MKQKSAGDGELNVFFTDTIVENTSKNKSTCTANILNALLVRIKKEVPMSNNIVLLSDNANSYVNLTFPLMPYYICRSHSLKLQESIHPDDESSKKMVDAHFVKASRHVDSYIIENNLSMITPDHFADALLHDSGIKKTDLDFVNVNMKTACVLK